MSYIISLDDLSQYSSNVIASDIKNTSNDLIRDIESTSNVIASDITNTSNSISNRITDLYTNDITFQQNVTVNNDLTVSGNLTVDGTTTSINTDSYTTEILEIVSTNVNDDKPVLKVVESGTVGNIIEVYKGANEVLSIDNSGKLITSDIQVNGIVTTTGTINGASATEMGYLDGVTSGIQTQLNAKQATITGAATTITSANLTANRALYSDGNGKIRASGIISTTELNYLDGVTSGIQTQLDAKQGTLSSSTDVTVKDLTADKIKLNYTDGNGIKFYTDNNWAIYMNASGAGNSFSGGTACAGYNFSNAAIRIRTNDMSSTQGIIYETADEVCKFSVRSDGLGYFKGGLQVDSNVTVKEGVLNVYNTQTGFNGQMQPGSLIIGDVLLDYGHETSMYSTNMAGMMLNCKDKTEIAVHDAGTRVVSLMAYNSNKITIGRNMGWGGIGSVEITGNVTVTGQKFTSSIVQCSSFQLDTNKFTIADVGTYRRINSHNNVPLVLNSLGNNVGIGTTAPTEKLEVSGNLKLSGGIIINETVGTSASSTNGTIVLNHEDVGGHSSIVFTSKKNRNSDYGYISYQDDVSDDISKEMSVLTIGTQNDGHNSVGDYIAIMPSAYCGIGTRTPTEKLEVNGNLKVTGNLKVKDIIITDVDPTIYFQDTNGRSSMIHCNSSRLYFLRGSGTNSTSWAQTNGAWPLVINLETNQADFGGHVTVKGNITTTGTINGVTAAQFSELASGGGGGPYTNYNENISSSTVLTNIKEYTFSNGKKYVIFLLVQDWTYYGYGNSSLNIMAIYENSSSTTTTSMIITSKANASNNHTMGINSSGIYGNSSSGGYYNPSTKTLNFYNVGNMDVYW